MPNVWRGEKRRMKIERGTFFNASPLPEYVSIICLFQFFPDRVDDRNDDFHRT